MEARETYLFVRFSYENENGFNVPCLSVLFVELSRGHMLRANAMSEARFGSALCTTLHYTLRT